MAGRLAIIACGGALPVQIAAAHPDAVRITLEGIPSALEDNSERHRLEKIGGLFEALRGHGVGRVVFAGALSRPAIDPAECDAEMLSIAPRVMAALSRGDDALLRQVMDIFEDRGFAVVAAHSLVPDLVAEAGHLAGPAMGEADGQDALRGAEILSQLSALDIGQGCVVAGGLCLGIETVQGTDALLRFVADTPAHLRRGAKGVLIKAPKHGQDLRVDMPASGPQTVAGAARAGLAGVVVAAGGVMILDRGATLQAFEDAGLFLMAQAM